MSSAGGGSSAGAGSAIDGAMSEAGVNGVSGGMLLGWLRGVSTLRRGSDRAEGVQGRDDDCDCEATTGGEWTGSC